MISIEITREDLKRLARTEVRNLPGIFFAGASPLLKPFMPQLEVLLPSENKGRGNSYILSALHSYIDLVQADEDVIRVKGGQNTAEITREQLAEVLEERYPATDHHKLNLPGLLFLQSGPGLQVSSASILRSHHELHLPEGRRTLRYIFHMGVSAINADRQMITICFDPDRLPRREDGSSVLEL
ncbi:MAG: hypothetical protein HPY61_10795 [Methanotrichaceae archaeon]|nr:hypothetical protein [Methanotrichaceae archaeon]